MFKSSSTKDARTSDGPVLAFLKKYWITALIFLGIVVVYAIVAENGILSNFLFPPIALIGQAFVDDWQIFLMNMVYSFGLLIPAVTIATLIALVIGFLLGISGRVREVFHPVVYTVSVIPSILLAPFALLLAPSFRSASLFLVTFATIWPTLFATITGVQTIDKRYLDNAATLGLSGFKRFYKIILPAASPSIIAGFVNALRGSFVTLVYAEMYGAMYGMGFFVKKYTEYGLYGEAWAGFVFMVVVLVIVMQIFEKIKNRMLRWTID